MTTLLRVTLVAASLVLFTPYSPAAHGAAGCHAASCTGKNPNTTGCARNAVTARSTSVDGVAVELRYSAACRSAWARIRNGGPGDRARVQNTIGQTYTATISSGNDVHTLMVNDAGIQSRACGTNVRPWPLASRTRCTGYY